MTPENSGLRTAASGENEVPCSASLPSNFAQADRYSCGAACVRQLLADADIHLSEQVVRDEARFVPGVGTWAQGLAGALSTLRGTAYLGGLPNVGVDVIQQVISKGGVLVQLRRHWVIADALVDGVMAIRDPHPFNDGDEYGSECELLWRDFIMHWREGQNQMVWRRA